MAPVSGTSKEAERAELHKTIWRIANDLRGSVDGWDFKSLRPRDALLPVHLREPHRLPQRGRAQGRQRRLRLPPTCPTPTPSSAARRRSQEKGFYILPQDLFANVRERARNDENLNETLSRVFTNIEASAVGTDSEDDIKGLFDDLDVNSAKLGPTVAKRNEKLVKLLDAIGDLHLGNGGFTDNTIDAFGDAYEYLMGMYASNAGKSGGEYYTPQEVSELLARITVVGKTEVNKVYDPACGSGSLLLKFAKVLGQDDVRQGFFGQEINLTTYNLCRINMFLHDINYEKFDIAHGDTLIDPAHWDDEPFEAIVSNPPYSIKWEGDANPLLINDERYAPAGVLAPKSKADLAFTMHMLSLARRQRHGGDRRVPRRALPRRRRAEDPQVPRRQQLRRHRHPAPARPLLRYDDRDLHHRAQEVEGRQQDAVHRRLGRVRPTGQQEQAHRRPPAEDPRRLHRPRGRRPLRDPGRQRRHRGQQLQHRGQLVRRGRGHPRRRSTSPSSTPRSRASSPGRPSCAPRSTPSSPTWREPSDDRCRPGRSSTVPVLHGAERRRRAQSRGRSAETWQR